MPGHERRNILISQLEKHAATLTPTVVSNPTTSQQPDDTRSSLLSKDQLAQKKPIVTRSVEESVQEIASNAVRLSVEALSNSPPRSNNNNNSSNPVIAIRDENEVGTTDISMTPTSNVVPQYDRPGQSVHYGNNCHEAPGPYIKKDQAREFFYLFELLPKNISTNNQPDDAMVLTLEWRSVPPHGQQM